VAKLVANYFPISAAIDNVWKYNIKITPEVPATAGVLRKQVFG
jgi:hypothetical protein